MYNEELYDHGESDSSDTTDHEAAQEERRRQALFAKWRAIEAKRMEAQRIRRELEAREADPESDRRRPGESRQSQLLRRQAREALLTREDKKLRKRLRQQVGNERSSPVVRQNNGLQQEASANLHQPSTSRVSQAYAEYQRALAQEARVEHSIDTGTAQSSEPQQSLDETLSDNEHGMGPAEAYSGFKGGLGGSQNHQVRGQRPLDFQGLEDDPKQIPKSGQKRRSVQFIDTPQPKRFHQRHSSPASSTSSGRARRDIRHGGLSVDTAPHIIARRKGIWEEHDRQEAARKERKERARAKRHVEGCESPWNSKQWMPNMRDDDEDDDNGSFPGGSFKGTPSRASFGVHRFEEPPLPAAARRAIEYIDPRYSFEGQASSKFREPFQHRRTFSKSVKSAPFEPNIRAADKLYRWTNWVKVLLMGLERAGIFNQRDRAMELSLAAGEEVNSIIMTEDLLPEVHEVREGFPFFDYMLNGISTLR